MKLKMQYLEKINKIYEWLTLNKYYSNNTLIYLKLTYYSVLKKLKKYYIIFFLKIKILLKYYILFKLFFNFNNNFFTKLTFFNKFFFIIIYTLFI